MNFNRYIAAGEFEELADFIRRSGRAVRLDKDDCFAAQGSANHRSGWVEQGAFRYVRYCDAGERHIVGYAFAGEFVGDYISMRSGMPSQVSIEATCASCVRSVSGETLEAFYRTDCGHERLGRVVAEHLLAEVYERLLQQYVSTPQERYEALLRRCPGLLEQITLHELASYLGIRPETLSRIRRRIR